MEIEEYVQEWHEEEEEEENDVAAAGGYDEDEDVDDDIEVDVDDDLEDEDGHDATIAECFIRRERQLFERQCYSLQHNKPSLKGFDRDWSGDNDAVRLGHSLMGNTHLEWLWVPLGRGLTARGAQALAVGIRFSRIRRLELHGEIALDSNITRILYMEALQRIPRVSISYPIRDADAIQLGQTLKGNAVVQELQIRVEEFTARAAQELSTGILGSQIKLIDLMAEDGNDSPEVKRILLLQAIRWSHSIRHLNMSDGVCVVDALASSLSSLQSLKLYGCGDVKNGIQILSDSLTTAPNLKHLSLSNCGLGDDQIRVLSSGLQNATSITTLCLSKNQIGNQGMLSFLEHWKVDSPIQSLDLSWNAIGDVGAQHLLRAAANQRALMELNLELNSNIGFNGMRLVGEEIQHLKLRQLYVDGCAIWVHYPNQNSAAAMAQAEARDRARQAVARSIQANVHLHLIRVYFLENFQESIQFYLNLNKNGRYLMSCDNEVAPGLWCRVFAKCRYDPSSIFYFLRELPTLVSSVRMSPRKRRRHS